MNKTKGFLITAVYGGIVFMAGAIVIRIVTSDHVYNFFRTYGLSFLGISVATLCLLGFLALAYIVLAATLWFLFFLQLTKR